MLSGPRPQTLWVRGIPPPNHPERGLGAQADTDGERAWWPDGMVASKETSAS